MSDPKTGKFRKWLGVSALVAFVAGLAAKLRRGSNAADESTVESERD